jgi:hypothetical protein
MISRTVLEAHAEPGHRHVTVKRQIAAQTLATLDALQALLTSEESPHSEQDRFLAREAARAALRQWGMLGLWTD